MRVIVLGGTGHFGARIARALAAEPSIELLVGSRRPRPSSDAMSFPQVALDMDAGDFAEALKALGPGLVIHCVGPFQGQDYRVAQATLAAGAHYVDLADGREFVVGFAAVIHAAAVQAGRVAVSGASTLPALSSAVVDVLVADLARVDAIEAAIAPGQRSPRGVATLSAVLTYLGRPFPVWEEGVWRRRWGWMDLRRVALAIGSRWGASCDVPDLTLFVQRYPGVRTVRFHAALEFGLQHAVLWMLATLRRSGVPLPVERWGWVFNRCASMLDRFGGDYGGMWVRVSGLDGAGRRVERTWQLIAPVLDGPQIPCLAAIVLARKLANVEIMPLGARTSEGLVSLAEFESEFSRWGITTQVEELVRS